MLPFLLAGLLAARDSIPEPLRIVRTIQEAVDRDGGKALEARWRATLARNPNDAAALLAVGSFERQRYRFSASDSLLRRLDDRGPAWRATALISMAIWRSLGSDLPRSDSFYVAARKFAREAGSRDLEAEAVRGLSQVRQRTQGPRVGLQLINEWWSLIGSPSAEDSVGRVCIAGALEQQLGDSAAGTRVSAAAVRAEQLKAWRHAGTCRLLLGQNADVRGFSTATSTNARAALAHFERIHFDIGIAIASQWYGYSLVRRSEYAAGRAMLERSLEASRATRYDLVTGWAHAGLAQMYLELGDLGLARRHAELAAISHTERGDLWGLANARRFEAAALERSGDVPAAIGRYAESERVFRRAGLAGNAVQVIAARASAFMRIGQLDSAERALGSADQAGRTVDAWRVVESPLLRGELAMRRGQLTLADSLLRTSPYSRMWREGKLEVNAVSHALAEAQVALRLGRVAVAESVLTATTRYLETSRRRPTNAGFTSALAELRSGTSAHSDAYPDLVAHLVARGRVAQAFAFIEQVRARDIVDQQLRRVARLSDTSMALAALRATPGEASIATLAEVQRALAPDEAWVTYVLGIDDVPGTAIVVTRDTATTFTLPTRAALVTDIRRYAQLAAAGTEATAAARRLGAALVAPVFAMAPSTITRVIVSPDGDLHRVPFDALRLADGRYALERASVSTAPSATALLALRARGGTPGDRVLALGDPAFARARATAESGRGGDVPSAFGNVRLPRLTHSGDEATRVASYGRQRTVLTGAAASEDALVRSVGRDVGVLHLATHALVDETSQEGTALVVAEGRGGDGFFTAGEISQLSLGGSLVVLSACRSSGGLVMAGEGQRGLTAPLLQAGARAVVATHWSIGDRSVVPFVDRFYAAMARGARIDDALREAKLAAIRDGVSIADWGAFAVTGDGGMTVPLRVPSRGMAPWLRNVTQVLRDTSAT